jgi:lipopolysaccharide transport system permease protein
MTASATRDAAALVRASSAPSIHIRRRRGFATPDLRELWSYRELVYFLAWRDVKVRYAQTALGVAWTLIQPIALTLVFTYAFHRLGDVQTEGVPYPLFALAGLAFWTFFSRGVTAGSNSLVENAPLLTKIYCPRLFIPLSTIVSALVDLMLSFFLLVGVAALYGYYPTWRLVGVLPILVVGIVFAAALTFFLSAINVRFRDIQQGLPFLVMLLLFLSPVAYPIDNPLLDLNPLVGIIDVFRWCIVGTPVSATSLALSIVVTGLALVVGAVHFSRTERTFADFA